MNTSIETYKVIFSGKTLNGQSSNLVARRFSEAFNLNSHAELEHLFSGKVITLKRGLTHEAALRYCKILNKLGADCCIECELNLLAGDGELDNDYQRKKKRRVAQYSHNDFANVGLAPK